MIDINIRGVFATTQAALKHMKDGGRTYIMVGSSGGRARRCARGWCPTRPRREPPSRCLPRRCPEK